MTESVRPADTVVMGHDLYEIRQPGEMPAAACRRCGQKWLLDFVGWVSEEAEAADLDCDAEDRTDGE